jgi:GNAT superfamily N-acetyltransferase
MPHHMRVDDEIELIHIRTPEEVQRWRAGFTGAYQTIFSDEPYYERIYPVEAEGVWKRLTGIPENITLLAVRNGSQVVSFGIAIPLRGKADVARQLAGLVPVNHAFYFAELGVLHDYRAKGLGRLLVQERLKLIDSSTYNQVILRVGASRTASYEMYRSMGFEDMGVYMEVQAMRIDGRVTSDRRLFMSCVISQIQQK